jgi:hypothetical protein
MSAGWGVLGVVCGVWGLECQTCVGVGMSGAGLTSVASLVCVGLTSLLGPSVVWGFLVSLALTSLRWFSSPV